MKFVSHEDTKMAVFGLRPHNSIDRCGFRNDNIEARLRRERSIFVSSCEDPLREIAA